MKKNAKQKLFTGCLAAVVALSATLTPVVANAATSDVPSAVTRIGGYDQYATAALMAQKGWTETCDSVVLSAGMTYSLVDALAAGPLATKLKAPILLTDNGVTLNASAKAELLRLKPKKAYITSGTAVIKQSVLDEISAMGITPVQLGGYDQYETSVNIAKELANQGVDISKVVLAAGWLSPADALSVAPIAAAQGMPILTTTQGQLPASVKSYLDSIDDKITNSYVVGGTAVVSDAVKGQLPGKVSRYSGQTKYDSNIQILKSFAKQYKNDKVYVANGETLVDALSVVPLAATSGSPVVLVEQQLNNVTKDFVKLNLSTDDMVAVGGEVVVPSAAMNALTSAVQYSTDSETVGSTDEATPAVLTDNVRLTGDSITLQNAQANYSIYVKGDNITLNNVTVKGTVFVDPGDTGTATLDGVTAANIVILSGASDTIHIRNTTAGVLTVDSSSNVRVEATGSTAIGDTVVRTFAVLDANGGSMGIVTITSTPGQDPIVELRGTFTEPVVVEGQVSLKAAEGAVVPSVVINTENADQKVALEGSFKSVEVQSQGQLALAANTEVETMKATAKVEITIPSTSSIGSLDSGSTGTLVSGGGTVNDEKTTSTPSAPATPSTPPSSGGSGGGSGSGSGGGTTTSTKIADFAILDEEDDAIAEDTVNGTSGTANLIGKAKTQMIGAIQITASPADSTLQLTSLVSPLTGTVTFTNKSFDLGSSSDITMNELLGGAISGGDVSLGTLRDLFGSYVTFKGTLSKSGYTQSTVSLRLDLSASSSTLPSVDWATMKVDETNHVITATIKSGKGGTSLRTIGVHDLLLSSVGVLPSSVKAQDTWVNPSTSEGREEIKDDIETLIGGTAWENATVSQLAGKNIYFKDQNQTSWTLKFNA